MDAQAYLAAHPIHQRADLAVLVEALGTPFTAEDGHSVPAGELAMTIRESRANGVHAEGHGNFLELRDDRGRSYGRFRFPTV